MALGLAFAGTAAAQDEAAAEWQATITGQVEAFRHGDAPGALSFAGAQFKEGFPDPNMFIRALVGWGYSPIMLSRSHSFGPYRMVSPVEVVQDVKFVGADQGLYEAYYVLGLEGGVWRVHAVQLKQTPGVGV
jgi:hypothetical protein